GTSIGADRILAGDGDDAVWFGTNEFRELARDFVDETGAAALPPVFYLDGGAGTDTLNISLATYNEAVRLTGGSAVTLQLTNGARVRNFENLGQVFTGSGDDALTQLGDYDNVFDTGAGQDTIRSGLGADTINGGVDFASGPDGVVFDLASNGGDLLV